MAEIASATELDPVAIDQTFIPALTLVPSVSEEAQTPIGIHKCELREFGDRRPEASAVPKPEPKPPEVASMITRGDQKELLSYFGMGGVSGAFEQSPLAGMLEHVALYAFHARPCERCGGDEVKLIAGCGFVSSSKKAKRQSEQQRVLLEAMGIVLPPGTADRVCGDCGGRGWVCPVNPTRTASKNRSVTAIPTGSSKHGLAPSVTVDAADMATLGTIGKRLAEVKACHADSASAIESWFGTPKDEGGQSTRALWQYTAAGKALLERNTLAVPAPDFFENERTDQAAHPNENRRITFKAADTQATKLWRETCQLWNATAPVKKTVVYAKDLKAEPESDPVAAE